MYRFIVFSLIHVKFKEYKNKISYVNPTVSSVTVSNLVINVFHRNQDKVTQENTYTMSLW